MLIPSEHVIIVGDAEWFDDDVTGDMDDTSGDTSLKTGGNISLISLSTAHSPTALQPKQPPILREHYK